MKKEASINMELVSAVYKAYPNAKIDIIDVEKVNTSYKGMTIRRGDEVAAPTFNLEEFSEAIENGTSIEKVLSVIDEIIDQDSSKFVPELTRQGLLPIMRLKLINKEKNPDILRGTPFIEWEDLAAVPIGMRMVNGLQTSFVLSNQTLEAAGIAPKEALSAGLSNTHPVLGSFGSVIFGQKKGMVDDPSEILHESEKSDSLFVLTNREQYLGASVLLRGDYLEKIADAMDEDFYIIPSSIHEILILRYDESIDPCELVRVIRDVNANVVEEQEVLSDSLYRYDRKTGMASRVIMGVKEAGAY